MTTYSAVRTTGIYCRPGCGARPRAENVTTFELAAAAEAAGYRACLKCRPYRVAGFVSPSAPELVCRAVQLILAGALDDDSEAALGHRLGISARHLRRLFNEQAGVTPSQLALSRRAHFARRLLDDSDLSITQVAFASGFGSVRHFNRAMRDVFRSSPRDLRARRRRHDRLTADGGLLLRVPFEPGFDWQAALDYLAARTIVGVEAVDQGTYRRTIVLDGDPGVLEVAAGGADHLLLRVHLPYWEGLIHVVERATRMVGIGVRVPMGWSPFEVGVRGIVGDDIDAIVRECGTPIGGLEHGLTHAFPSPETVARAHLQQPVTAFAAAVAGGALQLDGSLRYTDLLTIVDRDTAEEITGRVLGRSPIAVSGGP